MLLNSGQIDAQDIKEKTLADSLNSWARLDQTVAGLTSEKVKQMTFDRRKEYGDSIFNANKLRLTKVFEIYGYPGYDLVGKVASNNFWLMVQHCDADVPFQQKILKAMEQQVSKHNADPRNFAYLTDRIAINTNKKQVYGTQVTYNTERAQAIPKPLIDSANVDVRRKKVGLDSIESYLNTMSKLHYQMNKGHYLEKGILGPYIIDEPK